MEIAMQIIGGDVVGLRLGGQVLVNQASNENLFDDNVLLRHNPAYDASFDSAVNSFKKDGELGIVMGFSNNYKEKLSEEELKKITEKKEPDPRFNVANSIGDSTQGYNPVIL